MSACNYSSGFHSPGMRLYTWICCTSWDSPGPSAQGCHGFSVDICVCVHINICVHMCMCMLVYIYISTSKEEALETTLGIYVIFDGL